MSAGSAPSLPTGLTYENIEEQALPGMPPAVVQRAVVHPRLVTVPALAMTCPSCKAEGREHNEGVIVHLARGGAVRVDCSSCGFKMLMRRPPENRVQVVGGLAVPERGTFDKVLMGHGTKT